MISTADATEKTFNDCYSDTAIGMLFIADLNPNDPEIKNLITNLCNFYYEKTGEWITHIDWLNEDMKEKYAYEFYLKYKDTIPESMKQLFY